MLPLNKTLKELAVLVKGRLVGDGSIRITGLNGIKEARDGDLTFLANSKYTPLAKETKASAILVAEDMRLGKKPLIVVKNPSYAFSQIVNDLVESDKYALKGIHPSAVIAKDATIGKKAAIGAHAVIESGAKIGEETLIEAGTFIGHESTIGRACHIYPNVTIRERTLIGDRVIIHSGTVIGSDGFGFEMVDGAHAKIPQIGIVQIDNDVEIGANVTIDRARFNKTTIGEGTKIDNLVQIGHNVTIGKHCIIVALVGIAGSVEIKDKVILAGQSGVVGHLTIGEGVVVAAKSGVTKDIPPYSKVSGFPAIPHDVTKKLQANLKRLPSYIKTVKELKKKIEGQTT